ncbi:TetR/AcrR family transcriptional regulator [Rathayibacter rathayi]|uniref:TetR/AcrR family transcriptional regulator n=1 Tax=Rathayibacter rathayi TaxID=33887 RepID=UPI000CE8116A|nr:TetR/AcrR family transcriptional regulator [Rathayibacter rathayi]PPG14425.1 hypothetical protein C5C11_05155 [Rathayibacter rathayi]
MTTNAVDNPSASQHRERALRLAAAMFLQHGFRDAADRPATTDSNLRRQLDKFPTKSSLAIAILDEVYNGVPFLAHSSFRVGATPLQHIVMCCHAVVAAFQEDPLARATLRIKRDRGLITGELPEPHALWAGQIEDMLERAIEWEELPPTVQPEPAALLLVSAFHGITEIVQDLGMPSRQYDLVDELLLSVLAHWGVADPSALIASAKERLATPV